jgi:broad specificity phosphatase PhoE
LVATRITLICHGSTIATRKTAFPLDEPLEAVAVSAAEALAERLPRATDGQALTSPALRCRQTAELLELSATVDTGLADWDLGAWAGRTLTELSAQAPTDVQAWITDPAAQPHGGEALTSLIERVGRWLDAADDRRPRVLAVTHPAVIRAAIVHTLRAPADSFWRIDVSPLGVVEVRGRPGRWSLHT